MKRLSTVTPGWLAINLRRGGETMSICMLATAMLVSGDGEDEEISCAFESMAGAFDPLEDLRGFWADQLAEHPWMKIGPLVDWLEGAPDAAQRTVRRLASTLSEVSLSRSDEAADNDLVARVLQEMRTIQAGKVTEGQWGYFTFEQQMIRDALGMNTNWVQARPSKGKPGGMVPHHGPLPFPKPGQSIMDAWCGSGTRFIALGMQMRARGLDPTTVRWVMQEADGMMAAIACVNMVAYDMGEHVEMIVDPAYQNAMLAAGVFDLPPAEVIAPQW